MTSVLRTALRLICGLPTLSGGSVLAAQATALSATKSATSEMTVAAFGRRRRSICL